MPIHKNNQANPTRNVSSLKNLWPFLRPYRGKMGLALLFLCLGSVAILIIPLAFRDLIDFGFGQQQKISGGLFGSLSLNGRFLSLFGMACLWGHDFSTLLHRKLDRRTGDSRYTQRGVWAGDAPIRAIF